MLRVALVSPRHTTRVSPVAGAPLTNSPGTSARAAAAVPLPTRLHAITEAYAAGDAPLAERLFLAALDEDLPWDMVCAAAARGIAAHRAATDHAASVASAAGAPIVEGVPVVEGAHA